MQSEDSTIVAIATPAGRGGIGILRISGPKAFNIAQKLSGKENIQARLAHFSSWKDACNETIDAGLLLFFPNPASYTGEDVVELQGHGSPVLLQALLRRCMELGCIPAQAGEFTRRAVSNGRMDLSQAEAVIACIDATTERAAKQAQKHLAGDFGKKIETLMDKLTGIVAHVEACLDFPEEEIPALFLNQLNEQLQAQILSPMQSMLASASFGERLFNGASVAIIGAPNVGKSSLLNALSGRERAIISDIAGTTRDTLEVDFEVHGIPIRLVDTAGIRESHDSIEQEGIRRTKAVAESADLVIWVADATQSETWQTTERYDIAVFNKIDLIDDSNTQHSLQPVQNISANTGQGLSEFIQQLAHLLGEQDSEGEAAFVTSARHRQAIELAQSHVQQALPMLLQEEQIDLAALELRQAWSSLGEILGIGDVEYILDRVFSEFCIGK
ncbi:MAG: tRNA uridine-5-carboxymethylaminomethyl(34) synthesis GTPase MnmE [Mariprofundaceae bacterium]